MKAVKFALTFFLLIPFFFFKIPKTSAVENPLVSPNNTSGIHIFDENDLQDAANLVNSSGGDWGYVTIVIRKDEQDTKRWQRVFDKMRRLHLIPLVRIATQQQEGGWEKPSFDEIDGWVSFLNSLNWVIKNRYVIVGNEPNHATEWGSNVNPEEYAEYLYMLATGLKRESEDFFIMPAGLDASAPNKNNHLGEDMFIRRMFQDRPEVFELIDGWTSHSYPNPDFSGSEKDTGRGTVKTFDWELSFLKSLGIDKIYPVFITETGWSHDMDEKTNGNKKVGSVSESITGAFRNAWKDDRIVAVTPFILNYQEPPFDVFSWKKKDGSFYDFYSEVQKMPKFKGKPIQIISGKIITVLVPQVIKRDDKLWGIAYAKNTGQTIWNREEKTFITDNGKKIEIDYPILSDIEPDSSGLVLFTILSSE